jgi:hypothetical protein
MKQRAGKAFNQRESERNVTSHRRVITVAVAADYSNFRFERIMTNKVNALKKWFYSTCHWLTHGERERDLRYRTCNNFIQLHNNLEFNDSLFSSSSTSVCQMKFQCALSREKNYLQVIATMWEQVRKIYIKLSAFAPTHSIVAVIFST